MKKMLLIYNPHSGKGNIEKNLVEIINLFAKNDYEITLLPTQRKHHCRDYLKTEAKRFDQVTVCGGDGMVNETFNALMEIDEESRPVVGYIPTGTTNDFAASSMIPVDYFEAAKIAAGECVARIDAGSFNDKYFCYVAAFGAFTSVAYDTPQQIKNIFGYAAYVIEGVKQLSSIKPYKVKFETDKGVFEDEILLGLVANSRSVAGVKVKRFDVDLSDGLFEVILLKKIAKATDVNQIIADLRNNNMESRYYYAFQTGRIKISSDENIAWTLDGEFGGEERDVEIQNKTKAIKIKVAETGIL